MNTGVAWQKVLGTGVGYFVVVFATGAVLGVLRMTWLLPRIGAVPAVLVELPIILGACWLVSARIQYRWPLMPAAAAAMGAVAFLLLMLSEAGLSVLLAGRNVRQHFALYAELPHQLGLAGQVAFATMPWIHARSRARLG